MIRSDKTVHQKLMVNENTRRILIELLKTKDEYNSFSDIVQIALEQLYEREQEQLGLDDSE